MDRVCQHCQRLRTPEMAAQYRIAAIGVLSIPLVEILVTPLQLVLERCQVDLPASIVAMLGLSGVMLAIQILHGGADAFYRTHMKGPTDFLGRHMSFGFVASFVMLSRDHISDAIEIPHIAAAFVTTTLLSYIGCFLFVMGSSKLESRLRGLEQKAGDIESQPHGKHISTMSLTIKSPERASQMSQLTAVLAHHESISALEKTCSKPSETPHFLVKTVGFWASLFLFLTVGLPVSFVAEYDMPLEAFCFICLWIASLLWQQFLKTRQVFGPYPRAHYLVVILFNPVLLTSALGTAYFWAKAAATQQSIDEILGAFRCHDTWASIISSISQGHDVKGHIGAGDLATALLDAGIVSLGLKMFEYRQELWNSFNAVFSASLVFAIVSLFLNVVFAHTMGLAAPEALAFAARNVTIALGVPAVRNLQGSTALTSALVVFSGMLYQMTGDLLLSWLSVPDRKQEPSADVSYTDAAAEKGAGDDPPPRGYNCRVVAAGVTVGINAAAMGTAHLIERDSRAAAYSALSMTMFGSFTAALTAVPIISNVLVSLASR